MMPGIIDKLKEAKVPYETSGRRYHCLRAECAGTRSASRNGRSGPAARWWGRAIEIFDRTTMGMSDFVQKLNYRRALQGELARTIAQMPEVERARVHLAVPERRLFATEQDRPRASVVVSLRGSQSLTGRRSRASSISCPAASKVCKHGM